MLTVKEGTERLLFFSKGNIFLTIDLHLSLASTREVTEGQSLILVCNSDGEPKPTFDSWIHTGQFISEGQRPLHGDIKDNVNTLTINNVSYTETGRYQCSAGYTVFHNSSHSDVIVRCKIII